MTKPELDAIENAGIVGAGGGGFPTHVKLGSQADTLIINAAECEPLINVDKQLLEYYFDKVLKGIKIASSLIDSKEAVLAVKSKNKKAIEAVEGSKTGENGPGLFELGDFYPAGDEQVLVHEVTGKTVPEGGIPLQVGVIVINVETLFNIADAVEGKSITDKFVTVNGEVSKPLTLKVPVGTPVKKLIEFCGGTTVEDYSVLDGGPMMGKLIDAENYAVMKTTKSIIVLPEDNIVVENRKRSIAADLKRAQAVCLSCRLCTDLCPRYLLGHDLFPDDMMKRMYRGEVTDEEINNYDFAYLCCNCGLCELYSCVVDLSARSLFNHIKERLAGKNIKNPHKRSDLDVNPFRDFRKVPTGRLKKRLEVDKYGSPTPLSEFNMDVEEVKIYLSQHTGAPSVPVVRVGETVKKGGLIAEIPEGKLGARVHSSMDGTIKEVMDSYIMVGK